MIIHAMTQHALPSGTCALSHLGVIAAEGPDAASFLHGQLTQDFSLLDGTRARLAALCTAKGRMIASFVGIRPQPESILLVCSQDILAATLKRLQMYVLRAKAKLRDASAEFVLYGLAGEPQAGNDIEPASAPWQRSIKGEASVVSLYPADGVARALWIAPAGTPAPVGPELDLPSWQWGEVRSGVAMLTTPVLDAFVPQMVNYESIGGVNFKKGCYPGQEVVARSQFRGTLKRRAYLMRADSAVSAGQEVFAASDAQQPVGTVVEAAQGPDGSWAALVSMQIAALDAGQLRAGGPEGIALSVQPLPYELLADI